MSATEVPEFTVGPIPRLFFRMAGPLMLGTLAMMSYLLADTFFVAQLGQEALTAISFTGPVVMLVISMALGLGAGVSSVVARAVGEGDRDHARRLVSDGLVLTILLSLLVTVLGLLSLDPLFLSLGATASTLPLIRAYMVPFYLGVVANTTFVVGGAVLRSHGQTRFAGGLAVAGSLLNLLIDPILIFGLFGFPRLEIQGAAIASILARLLGLSIGVPYLLRKRYAAPVIDNPAAMARSWRAILHVGLFATASQVLVPIASGIVLAMLARHSQNAVAAFGIAYRMEPVTLVPMYALSAIMGPFSGQNLGAKRYDRLQRGWRAIGIFALIFSAAAALLLAAVAPQLVGFFTADPEIQRITIAYFAVVPISYGFYGIVMNGSAACNGLGRPFPGTVMVFLRVIGLFVPLAFLLQGLFGLVGIFVAMCIANLIVGSGSYLWLGRRFQAATKQS